MHATILHMQNVLREKNRLVRSFVMAGEMSPARLAHGRLCLPGQPVVDDQVAEVAEASRQEALTRQRCARRLDSALETGRPSAARRPGEGSYDYSLAESLGEIALLTNEKAHGDLILADRASPGTRVAIPESSQWFDQLLFPLLFLEGAPGWHKKLMKRDRGSCLPGAPADTNHRGPSLSRPKRARASLRAWLRARLMIPTPRSHFRASLGRLYQEYVCQAWLRVQTEQLGYLRLQNHLFTGGPREGPPGRTVLPSTVEGSRRHMASAFYDIMAIVREHGQPALFVTITCNPTHPSIITALKVGDTMHKFNDQPLATTRVFEGQLKDFRDLVVEKGIFGRCLAFVRVLEWQQRGTTHAHCLVFLHPDDMPRDSAEVDKFVSATVPDPVREPRLFEAVTTFNYHKCTPARCLMDSADGASTCKRKFPFNFLDNTMLGSRGEYLYRRPRQDIRTVEDPSGIKRTYSPQYIVPYNPFVTLRLWGHVNVLIVASYTVVKYIAGYISKGVTRTVVDARTSSNEVDEIQNYEDVRVLGSMEAATHILSIPVVAMDPPVLTLDLHVDPLAETYWSEGLEARMQSKAKLSQLEAFFHYNAEQAAAGQISSSTYSRMNTVASWDRSKGRWKKRVSTAKMPAIGRVYGAHPRDGEKFYLRILLHSPACVGAVSWQDLLRDKNNPSGPPLASFEETCRAWGLLSNDEEWVAALTQMSEERTASTLRRTLAYILEFNAPGDPMRLVCRFLEDCCRDWHRDLHSQESSPAVGYLEWCYVSLFLYFEGAFEHLLRGPSGPVIRLRAPTDAEKRMAKVYLGQTQFQLGPTESRFDRAEQARLGSQQYRALNLKQKELCDRVSGAIQTGNSFAGFVQASAGTGKTFLFSTLLAMTRGEGRSALALAYTGVASLLMEDGQTMHSCFKLPVDDDAASDTEPLSWGIVPGTPQANRIRNASLIICDEICSASKIHLEIIDRGLQELMGNNTLFGGKVLLAGGDFKQTLPVCPGASKPHVLLKCLPTSYLWDQLEHYSLTENMRISTSYLGTAQDNEAVRWNDVLQGIGTGTLGETVPAVVTNNPGIAVPVDPALTDGIKTVEDLIRFAYPNLSAVPPDPTWLASRCILAPLNRQVRGVNDTITATLGTEGWHAYSSDMLDEAASLDADGQMNPDPEHLNKFDDATLPPHHLFLKKGMPVMLIRNINLAEGLAKGVRLQVHHVSLHVLNATFLTGVRQGQAVDLVRLRLPSPEGAFPWKWFRVQFPVVPAWSLTTHRAQGQTFRTVGLLLQTPCFSHGQLYVALSRVGQRSMLRVLLPEGQKDITNIVYKEVLNSMRCNS